MTFTLHLFNRGVIFLKRLHFAMTLLGGGNTLHGIVGTCQSGDVRNLVLDGSLTDSGFILDGVALGPRRIDDEAHLLVDDDVKDIRATFINLVHHFALHATLLVELGGAFRSVDLESKFLENAASRMSRQAACGLA